MRAMRRLLMALMLTGCAGPTAEKPAERKEPPPEVKRLEAVDRDVERLKEIQQLDRGNEEKKLQVASLEKTVAELQAKLDAALKAGTTPKADSSVARNEPGGNKVRVRLAGELVFTPGSARITRAGRKALSDIAGVLKTTPHKRIEVAGHTDSSPMMKKYEDNWQLSSERARRVVAYLHSVGVDGKHMIAAGYADTEPLETGGSADADRKNRRVEIFIEPTAQ
jgi:chemotaxis protein MotB